MLLIAQIILNSRLGRVTVALRGQEDRVRFTGYSVTAFKSAAFCFAAFAAGIGGAFFTRNVGFIHANFVGVVASIEMVIFCAVGGRFSIYGAVYGALIVNAAKTLFSEAYPEFWLFAMGLIFVGVVLAFQKGVAGFYSDVIEPRFRSSKASK